MEELNVPQVAPYFLVPHLPKHVSLNPLADEEAQPSKSVGKEHVARLVVLVLLIVNLRDVREAIQSKPFREVPRPDRL